MESNQKLKGEMPQGAYKEVYDLVRKIGSEHVVVASDLSQCKGIDLFKLAKGLDANFTIMIRLERV